MKRTFKKGFTLVELVIVIAVIAVLAAILVPTFMKVAENARFSADTQSAKNMSTLAKAAALNGPTDGDGEPMPDVNMNEATGVISFLKANGFDLKPRSKDSAFWYNRATGNVEILHNEEMFAPKSENASAGVSLFSAPAYAAEIGSAESEFEQDCLEALIKEKPSYVFIDQSENNPISQAITKIYALADAADAAAGTYAEKVAAMKTSFGEAVTNNDALKKLLGVGTPQASSAYTYLTDYSPDTCYYVGENELYTSQKAASLNLKRMLFRPGAVNFPSPKEHADVSVTFSNPVMIPMTVVSLAEGCMRSFDPQNTVVVYRNYTTLQLSNSGCAAILVNNTGKIQITYLNLQYDGFTYNQYGVRYFEYTRSDAGQAYETNRISVYSSLAELPNGTELSAVQPEGYGEENANADKYREIRSIYALPYVTLLSEVNGGQSITLPIVDENGNFVLDVKFYSKNVGNLTVMYGSIVSGDVVYRIQEIAYIKAVSTYESTPVSGDSYLMVSDPLAGAPYYNLEGITVWTVDDKGNQKQMTRETAGASKGDYSQRKDAGVIYEKVLVKDKGGNTILVQYL